MTPELQIDNYCRQHPLYWNGRGRGTHCSGCSTFGGIVAEREEEGESSDSLAAGGTQ